MKITLVFDSQESAEEAWMIHFSGCDEDWIAFLNSRESTIEIERSDQSSAIDLEIPVGVIGIII